MKKLFGNAKHAMNHMFPDKGKETQTGCQKSNGRWMHINLITLDTSNFERIGTTEPEQLRLV